MDVQGAGLRVDVGAPERLMPGVPARLGLRIEDANTGEAIHDIVETHERPIHLIVVNSELEFFRHIHPWPVGGNLFWVDVTFPARGRYYLFLEFQRAGGETLTARETFVLGEDIAHEAQLRRKGELTFEVEGLRVSLEPLRSPVAGRETRFKLIVTDADARGPVTSLTPYLAAAAHVVVIDSSAATFGHAHGSASSDARSHGHTGHAAHTETPVRFGRGISFSHVFPAPGLYRIWTQFGKADRTVATAAFDLQVD